MPSCLVSNSLEDFQGQGSHHTVSRRTVRKTRVETLSHLQGKMRPLPKGLASFVPEYLMDQLLHKVALCIILRRRSRTLRLQGLKVRTPQPTVPEGSELALRAPLN